STLNCNNGGGGTSTPTPTSTTPPGGSTTTLNPVADARVAAAAPTTNYGTQPTLLADTSPQEMSYLRFNVQGVNGTVTNAKLRLWVENGTSNGPKLLRVADNSWSETAINWNNRPATGTVVGDIGTTSVGTWVEYDRSEERRVGKECRARGWP